VDKVPTWADDVHKEIDLDAEVQASGFSKDDAMMLDEVRRQPNIRKQTNKRANKQTNKRGGGRWAVMLHGVPERRRLAGLGVCSSMQD
jgi:hypothetical protein